MGCFTNGLWHYEDKSLPFLSFWRTWKGIFLLEHYESHFFMPYSVIYCVCTNTNVTASAAVSALESALCVSSYLRLSSRVKKGLVGINEAVEDILTVSANKTLKIIYSQMLLSLKPVSTID